MGLRSSWMAGFGIWIALWFAGTEWNPLSAQEPPPPDVARYRTMSGSDLYREACANCHGMQGSGAILASLELPVPVPDFTDCSFASREPVLAADGVSCSACHQITADGLGDPSTFTGGFRVDESTPWGSRQMLGPFTTDRGRAALMRSATGFIPAEAAHIRTSELCASCHTLYTDALNGAGEVVGRLPEQVPYLEWQASAYPALGQGCQSCHMPVVTEPVPVTQVLGQPREGVSRHTFNGGNFFILGMLNRFRDELGVEALPAELDRAQRRTVRHLETETAELQIAAVGLVAGRLEVTIDVRNLAGHKLPTAYPSRRVWVHLRVRDAGGSVLFESGALRPDGSIVGNDNDEDGSRIEPHYLTIERADQVQVYEAIMVDSRGAPTTGLLRGVRFAKDNRLLPTGFNKASAHEDIAVRGEAREDSDFLAGGDRVNYQIPMTVSASGVIVEATLRFQPIGYRWAHALRDYDAFETNRFVEYYDEMSASSAVALAVARMVIE